MRTTSFATSVQRFVGNHVRNSQKGGTTMKLLRSLFAVAALGMGTPVYADGLVTIAPGEIKSIGTVIASDGKRNTQLILKRNIGNVGGNCPVNDAISIVVTDPIHDRAFVMFNTALLTSM